MVTPVPPEPVGRAEDSETIPLVLIDRAETVDVAYVVGEAVAR